MNNLTKQERVALETFMKVVLAWVEKKEDEVAKFASVKAQIFELILQDSKGMSTDFKNALTAILIQKDDLDGIKGVIQTISSKLEAL